MKRLPVLIAGILLSVAVLAAGCGKTLPPPGQQGRSPDGKAIFQGSGCGACHSPNAEGAGPSLSKIAGAYAGKKSELVGFLEGKGQPIVEPDEFPVMKPLLADTETLNAEARNALADYILGQ